MYISTAKCTHTTFCLQPRVTIEARQSRDSESLSTVFVSWYPDVCSRMLTYADSESLSSVFVSWYPDVC